jgi:hypothetical protein
MNDDTKDRTKGIKKPKIIVSHAGTINNISTVNKKDKFFSLK